MGQRQMPSAPKLRRLTYRYKLTVFFDSFFGWPCLSQLLLLLRSLYKKHKASLCYFHFTCIQHIHADS